MTHPEFSSDRSGFSGYSSRIELYSFRMRKIDLDDFQVATSETARDINRRIVLNLIRSHQPVSRADLARHSGLQRSTVSVIAEQLITEKWVREGAIGHTVRGRRPRFLHLNKGAPSARESDIVNGTGSAFD